MNDTTDSRTEADENVQIHNRVDGAEDVRCWMVEDDDLRDDDELEGALFCTECINSYVGDGTVHSVSHEGMMADAYCHKCGAYLGDSDE